MQMSQVLSINRVFLHKLHRPPCYLGNFADYGRQFHEDDHDTWSQSQNEEGPSRLSLQSDFCRILAQPSSLKHQQRSDKVVPLRDYEISFLFLLLVKFHRSGKSEIYSPVQRIIQCFFTKCYFKLRHRKRRHFISECDVRPNGFQQFFLNFDAMLGFQSRDRWSLNTAFTWLEADPGYKPRPQTSNLKLNGIITKN